MKAGILGTGMVGNSIATKLISLGYQVMMGSRTKNNEKALAWMKNAGDQASAGTFEDAALFGEIVFNCTSGGASLDALNQAGAKNLSGKILIDVANPLDFSKGMPPILIPSLSNTNSLGEEIQKKFPDTMVIKTLNTMNATLMTDPQKITGDHAVFISGNDDAAKEKVREILTSFGWRSIFDLGDISTARGTEMLLPIWLRLWGTLKTPMFNFKIVM